MRAGLGLLDDDLRSDWHRWPVRHRDVNDHLVQDVVNFMSGSTPLKLDSCDDSSVCVDVLLPSDIDGTSP